MKIVLTLLIIGVLYVTASLSSQTVNMVLIPAGEFRMGSNNGERDEKPVHTVYLDAFYIDKHEVTVAEYKEFVEATGHRPLPESVERTSPTDQHPVVQVSWQDAMAYAKWAGKRLPTEAEWEKAARGGLIAQDYPWGDAIDASSANYNKNTKSGAHDERATPVGAYPANGYGLHDMSGNVAEWCLDTYHRKFYADAPRDNPIAGAENVQQAITNAGVSKEKRVVRGGSWSFNAKSVRVANRLAEKPSLLSSDVGFRCVKVVGTRRVPSRK
ncbi:MAG: formylglycine-generating enzyme family protein [Candidatus Poribacteria bacterium]|nr:formylglycine-generating enzyme family protein [Candidatus Poribacteria bacterium]